jgi:2-keto-4-pentenoate hydratase
LEEVETRVRINGREVARGFGSAVLGNPLNSIAWLAGKLGLYGQRLRAGDIVMTGSFVRQFPLSPGDIVAADFSGIGRVEAGMAKT